MEDQKVARAAVALFNVPCADSLCPETRQRRLLAENPSSIHSWLRSLGKKARICLLGLTLNITVFHVLCIVAS